MWFHLVFALVGLLPTSTQAFAPIQWVNSPTSSLVLTPKGFGGNFRGLPSQELMLSVTPDIMSPSTTPYFSAKSDGSITWDDMGLCIEAGGESGNVARINSCSGEASQKWNWIPDANGKNMIQLQGSTQCLDVLDKSEANGALVGLRECDRVLTDSWKFEEPHSSQQSSDMRNLIISLIALVGAGVLSLGAWMSRWQRKPSALVAHGGGAPLLMDQSGVSMILRSAMHEGSSSVGHGEFGWNSKPAVSERHRNVSMNADTPVALRDLAVDCLEEGCPVDMVSELLTRLKAEKNPTPELAQIIEELEKLSLSDEVDQNEVSKLVASLAKSYTMPNELMAAMGEALSGITRTQVTDYEDLAVACLEEGCPVDKVSDLISKLKQERNPDPELAQIIRELEKLSASSDANQDAISKLVAAVAKTYVTPTDLFGVMREAWKEGTRGPDYRQLAVDCLEDGCPVDRVSYLVNMLKEEGSTDPELAHTIKELERLSNTSDGIEENAFEKRHQNAIEKLVTAVRDSIFGRHNVVGGSRKKEQTSSDDKYNEDSPAVQDVSMNATSTVIEDLVIAESDAEECLNNEDCPIEQVSELLSKLKAEADTAGPNASPYLARLLDGLERELAVDCLEEACPQQIVSDLLTTLKAEKNPDSEMAQMIQSLESFYPSASELQAISVDQVPSRATSATMSAIPSSSSDTKANKKKAAAMTVAPTLSVFATPHDVQELAIHCIEEEGCSVRDMSDLLMLLKNQEDPDTELVLELERVLADSCINGQECELDTVSEVLSDLKAEKDPEPEIAQSIEGLEFHYPRAVPTDLQQQGGPVKKVRRFMNKILNRGSVSMSASSIEAPVKDFRELAVDCLEEGCPVDMVSELLSKLKEEKNPDPELAQTIKELEKLSLTSDADQNAISKLVASVAKNYITPGDLLGALSEALNGRAQYRQLAVDCLEEGCPVDQVSYLVSKLKEEKNPDPELVQTIKELEELFNASVANKKQNPIQKLVAAIAKSYIMPSQLMGAMSEAVNSKPNYRELAVDCLEEGCPVDMVADLVDQLKAERNPDPELIEIIQELEKLSAAEDADQNAIAKLVAAVAKSYITPLELMGAMGETLQVDRANKNKKLAVDCLEEGCPVDMVSDLLSNLKAEKNPDPETVKLIRKLEKLSSTDDSDQSEIAELVAQVAKNYSSPNGLLHVLGSSINGARDATTSDYAALAVDCLEEGCPVDMVSELLDKLKAVENPDAELAQTIEELEKLSSADDADETAISQLVAAVAKNYTLPKDLMGVMSETVRRR